MGTVSERTVSTIEQSRAPLWTTAGIVAGLAALYLVVGALGLQLAHVQRNTTLIWAPTGLSFAALLLYGIRVWPGVLLGATGVGLLVGTGPFPALAIGIGNTLEAVAAACRGKR
jgi:integral membrane sensor domain MASE1